MDMCMDRCCAQRGCSVAYMVDNNCFSVSCFSPTLCKISDVPSSNGDVKISTIMNSTAERHSEKSEYAEKGFPPYMATYIFSKLFFVVDVLLFLVLYLKASMIRHV